MSATKSNKGMFKVNSCATNAELEIKKKERWKGGDRASHCSQSNLNL